MYLGLGQTATARPPALTRVPDVRQPPFFRICRIVTRTRDPVGTSYGTGFLIGTHHVLTSAHNIYPAPSLNVESITVIPGQHGPVGKRTAFRANGWAVTPGWRLDNCRAGHLDLGIIRLPRSAQRGFFRLQDFDPARLVGQVVDMAGYPSSAREPEARFMHRSRGPIIRGLYLGRCTPERNEWLARSDITTDTALIAHRLASAKSMSGSPLWIVREGRWLPVAVHAGREADGRMAKAVLLTAAVRKRIADWMTVTLPPL